MKILYYALKLRYLTASTSLWETIRTPSLFTSRSPSLNVPLCVLHKNNKSKFQIHQNIPLLTHTNRESEREREITGTWLWIGLPEGDWVWGRDCCLSLPSSLMVDIFHFQAPTPVESILKSKLLVMIRWLGERFNSENRQTHLYIYIYDDEFMAQLSSCIIEMDRYTNINNN